MTTDPEHVGAGVYHRQIDESELDALDEIFSGGGASGETGSEIGGDSELADEAGTEKASRESNTLLKGA